MAKRRRRGRAGNAKVRKQPLVRTCRSWDEISRIVAECKQHVGIRPYEEPWFRGSNDNEHQLVPSLLWQVKAKNKQAEIDDIEQDLFFEFQARASELHERGLTDWDYLFFMRHHGVPTRILDWTESLGVATFFAVGWNAQNAKIPCIWLVNPWALSERGGQKDRDVISPKYFSKGDYGGLLQTRGKWPWKTPLPFYPIQIAERMRAQSGWFTIHGESTAPLDEQCPELVVRIDLERPAIAKAKEFLEMADLTEYRLFPDLDHLAMEVTRTNGLSEVPTKPVNAIAGVAAPGHHASVAY